MHCGAVWKRRYRWWNSLRTILVCSALVSVFVEVVAADGGFQSRSHFECTEREPPFDPDNCQFFTQYAALVDLVGGGAATQLIKIVGTKSTPLVNLLQHDDGTIECPKGATCTPIKTPDGVEVSIIRSPLPAGIPRIMPNGSVSVGFYWKLTRNNHYSDDYRVPYAYKVSNCSASAPHSSCADATGSVEFRTFDPFDDDPSLDIQEPSCAADCEPGFDLRGTCGSNVPQPDGYLPDNDGRCSELCCGSASSVKVRQLSPFCYMMSAQGNPGLAVDFAVTVKSRALGPDPVVVPVYGVTDPQSVFVNDKGIRVRILSLVHELERFDNTNAFSVVHGSIVICPNHTDPGEGLPGTPLFPNEVDGPVANVSDMQWFYMPSTYVPFYRDATAAEAAQIIKPSTPVQSEHQKLFGESGSVVEQAAAGFIERTYGAGAVNECVSLSGVLPLVPGYDVDEPLTDLSQYELPSPCEMWSQARLGNRGFLPPAFGDIPNWFVRRGIPDAREANATFDPNDLYLVYVPTEEQIAEASAEKVFENAMLMSVEFNDKVAAYDSLVTVPVTTSVDDGVSVPSCVGPYPKDTSGFKADVTVHVSIKNAAQKPLDPGVQASPVSVRLVCNTPSQVGAPVFVRNGSTQTVNLAFNDQKTLEYVAEFTFDRKYDELFKKGESIGSCVALVTGAASGNGQVGPITCSAGPSSARRDNNDPDCGFFDIECQHDEEGKDYVKIGAVQMWIGIGAGLLAVTITLITLGVVAYRRGKMTIAREGDADRHEAARVIATTQLQDEGIRRAKKGERISDIKSELAARQRDSRGSDTGVRRD